MPFKWGTGFPISGYPLERDKEPVPHPTRTILFAESKSPFKPEWGNTTSAGINNGDVDVAIAQIKRNASFL